MHNKKTKIVCTIGPASSTPATLKQMMQEGMDVVRLNFSHGTHQERHIQITDVRRIAKELNKPIAIFADLQGPKLRLGLIEGVKQIQKGDHIDLSVSPEHDEFPIQFDLSPFVKAGQRIFLNDGLVELKITEVTGKTIKSIALNNGVVSSNKGVNIPDTSTAGASFTAKDEADAIFALQAGVDYLALSFVQSVEDLKRPLELIKKYKPNTKIIVKIEKRAAIENLESILEKADVIMVARGDLAIETSNAEVPILQQQIIKLCRQNQKPVIIATQMLESMIENPRPTRAEVSDVANAVLDQVDCVMLSAESAQGRYPVEVVSTMRNIIASVEKYPDYKHFMQIDWENLVDKDVRVLAIASSATSLATRLNAEALVVGTASGKTARLVSAFRPNAPILAITHDETTQHQLNLVWGIEAHVVKPTSNFNIFLAHILDEVKSTKQFKKGDKIVMVTGNIAGMVGDTSTIEVTEL